MVSFLLVHTLYTSHTSAMVWFRRRQGVILYFTHIRENTRIETMWFPGYQLEQQDFLIPPQEIL